jgi:hypothetical protein
LLRQDFRKSTSTFFGIAVFGPHNHVILCCTLLDLTISAPPMKVNLKIIQKTNFHGFSLYSIPMKTLLKA